MNVCVFCSAAEVDKKYARPAAEFGALLAKAGHTLVWGGSDRGLMKIVADAVDENGGKIVGISFELLKHRAREKAAEMIVEKDLSTRKATMLARTDVFVALVGGIGTLDELGEILALKTHEIHHKPIILLDTDHFYEAFKAQLRRMQDERFLHKPLEELMYFADTPQDAMRYIENHVIH
ncbi:MAG: hypothetical protein UY63_C0018G0014 [Parcubacteria group bacterium GW2011_GWA2_51_10]|nr:MAG: hypothetical protein UY63_C0018G0014 [Parcubacteria group bacterium GW2011_GWA2_51_10]